MTTNPVADRLIRAADTERDCWRDLADQGTQDGAEWARDYATPAELESVSKWADADRHDYELSIWYGYKGRPGDVDVRDELDELRGRLAQLRTGVLLDPCSATLLAFLRERRNRPVFTPDAVTIDMGNVYWTGFQGQGGFFEGAASVWREVRTEVGAALAPKPNPLATPADPWGVPF